MILLAALSCDILLFRWRKGEKIEGKGGVCAHPKTQRRFVDNEARRMIGRGIGAGDPGQSLWWSKASPKMASSIRSPLAWVKMKNLIAA